jgi:hypothetical protein
MNHFCQNPKTLTRKTLSCFLAALLLLAVLPVPPLQADSGISVNIRIEALDTTLLPLTEIELSPYDLEPYGVYAVTDDVTVAHALVQVLIDQGMDDSEGWLDISGGMIRSILGLENDNVEYLSWLYSVNEVSPMESFSDCVLADGDTVVIYYADWLAGYRANFDRQELTVEKGEEFTLALSGVNIANEMFSISNDREQLEGAELLISEAGALSAETPTGIFTDDEGAATLSIAEPGVYLVSATRESDYSFVTDVSRPWCRVTVTEPNREVYVRIEGAEETLLPRTPVTVEAFALDFLSSDVNLVVDYAVGEITAMHALVQALRDAGLDPATNIALGDGADWGDYPTAIMGEAASASTYWQFLANDKSDSNFSMTVLQDGDDLVFNLIDSYKGSTSYFLLNGSSVSKQTLTVVKSEPLTLRLVKADWSGNESPVAGAGILLSAAGGAVANQATPWQTDADGDVTLILTEAGDYVISARHEDDGGVQDIARPYALIRVSDAALADAEAVLAAKVALSLGQTNAVVRDLILPTAGSYGTAISWASSAPAVVSTTGQVQRPSAAEGNADVTLTATITKGDAAVTKVFAVTVRAALSQELGLAQSLLDNAKKYYDVTRGKVLADFWDLGAVKGAWGDLSGYTVPDYTGAFTAEQPNDYVGRILGMLAEGLDPRGGDRDFVAELNALQRADGKFSSLENHQIWPIIANHAALSDDAYRREDAVHALLALQQANGSIPGAGGVLDTTAMTLVALAGARDLPGVEEAITAAVAYFASQQNDDGGWSANSNTLAEVISGLTAVGENVTAPEWTRSGGNPVTALAEYQLASGGFAYSLGGTVNHLSTNESVIALRDILSRQSTWYELDNDVNFSEPAEKVALVEAVERASALDASRYTADSYDLLTEALATAALVLDDPEAGSADILAAIYAIEEAEAALVALNSGGRGNTSPSVDLVRSITRGISGPVLSVDFAPYESLPMNIFQALSTQPGKTLVINCGAYTWSILSSDVSAPVELNLQIDESNRDLIYLRDKLSSDKILYLSFAHEGQLPGKMTVVYRLPVTLELETELYLYHYDPVTGILEQMPVAVTVYEGLAMFTLTHCSDYILAGTNLNPELLLEPAPAPSAEIIPTEPAPLEEGTVAGGDEAEANENIALDPNPKTGADAPKFLLILCTLLLMASSSRLAYRRLYVKK